MAAGLPNARSSFRFLDRLRVGRARIRNMNNTHWSKTFRHASLVSLGLMSIYTPAVAGKIAPDLDRQVRGNPNSGKQQLVIVQFNRSGVDADALAKLLGGKKLAKLGLI